MRRPFLAKLLITVLTVAVLPGPLLACCCVAARGCCAAADAPTDRPDHGTTTACCATTVPAEPIATCCVAVVPAGPPTQSAPEPCFCEHERPTALPARVLDHTLNDHIACLEPAVLDSVALPSPRIHAAALRQRVLPPPHSPLFIVICSFLC